MKTKIFSSKLILLSLLLSVLFGCQTDDVSSVELQNKEVKFAINSSGKILENLPPEILTLMIQKFELTGDKNKIELLKNTYNLKTGSLTKLALESEKYIALQNDYANKNLKSTDPNHNYYGYRAYVAGKGWLEWTQYGEIIGTTGESRRLEAIQFGGIPVPIYKIREAHLSGLGWVDELPNEFGYRMLGTTGQSRQMEAIRIGFAGYYRAYVKDFGWLPWVSMGEIAGTVGQNRRMEAFQLIDFAY